MTAVVEYCAVGRLEQQAALALRGGEYADFYGMILLGGYNINNVRAGSLLHDTDVAVGHEVLRELLLLKGHEPSKVGLILGVHTGHELDVGPETRTNGTVATIVGQIAVPRTTEVTVAPRPLLLARRIVV